MAVGALRLDRVAINVGNIVDAARFYTNALGFIPDAAAQPDPSTATLLGVHRVQSMLLQRGRQRIELTQCDPPGKPYPAGSLANDLWFQHCALVTNDIAGAYQRLCQHAFTPISQNGPQILPGGIAAFKFRDPDGHPLELIQFPNANPATAGGIDHSAISVSNVERSIRFYTEQLSLSETARQVNTGPAQDALDGLHGVTVDVLALVPAQASPHLELLCYRAPQGRAGGADGIAAARLVFTIGDGLARRMIDDPDGHRIVLDG